MGNHWTSTRPGTRFTTLCMVSRALPEGRAGLMERQLSVCRLGQSEEREITDAKEYRALLSDIFNLQLKIGRAHVWTPVTNAKRVCSLLLEKQNAKTQLHSQQTA